MRLALVGLEVECELEIPLLRMQLLAGFVRSRGPKRHPPVRVRGQDDQEVRSPLLRIVRL